MKSKKVLSIITICSLISFTPNNVLAHHSSQGTHHSENNYSYCGVCNQKVYNNETHTHHTTITPNNQTTPSTSTTTSYYCNICNQQVPHNEIHNHHQTSIPSTPTTPTNPAPACTYCSVCNQQLCNNETHNHHTTNPPVTPQTRTAEPVTEQPKTTQALATIKTTQTPVVTPEMGEIIIEPTIPSNNTNLKLLVDQKEVIFINDKASINVPIDVNKLNYEYLLEDQNAKVEITESEELTSKKSVKTFKVTAPDGTEKYYELEINKSPNIEKKIGTTLGLFVIGDLGYGIYRFIKKRKI